MNAKPLNIVCPDVLRIDAAGPMLFGNRCESCGEVVFPAANGDPIGASGLRQIYEICQQLRGQAGARQVPGNPKHGYTHVYGAPGLSAVTILQR